MVDELSTKITAREDLVGALVLGARRMPPEAIEALINTYWRREKQIAAVTAAATFIHAHAQR